MTSCTDIVETVNWFWRCAVNLGGVVTMETGNTSFLVLDVVERHGGLSFEGVRPNETSSEPENTSVFVGSDGIKALRIGRDSIDGTTKDHGTLKIYVAQAADFEDAEGLDDYDGIPDGEIPYEAIFDLLGGAGETAAGSADFFKQTAEMMRDNLHRVATRQETGAVDDLLSITQSQPTAEAQAEFTAIVCDCLETLSLAAREIRTMYLEKLGPESGSKLH